jgi:hypothetical protein
MSELSVGQLRGLTVNDNVISMPAGHKLYAPGHVIQVVQVVKTDTFSTSSTTMTDLTGLVASITPLFTSSKILIQLTLGSVDTTVDNLISGDVTRNGTVIGVGDASGVIVRTGWNTGYPGGNRPQTVKYDFLDFLSTTSAITYQARIRAYQGTAFVNRAGSEINNSLHARTISTLTLMEIAQ